MSGRPAKTRISLGICPLWSESSLSAWRKLGSLATHWANNKDWSDWVDAQADLSLRWAHTRFAGFVASRLISLYNPHTNIQQNSSFYYARHLFRSFSFTFLCRIIWAPSSEFVSSSIPSWQILTAHAQTFRGVRDLAFYLKVPLDSLLA